MTEAPRLSVLPVSGMAIEKLRTLRKIQKMSAQGLADAVTELGLPTGRSTVANMECQRKSALTLDYAYLAAQALGTDLWTLLTAPVVCPQCKDVPREGFTCNTCGGTS